MDTDTNGAVTDIQATVAVVNPGDVEMSIMPDPFDDLDKKPTKAAKRTRRQREEDLETIGQMMLQKKTQQQMVTQICSTRPYKIGRSQIMADVREIETRIKSMYLKPLAILRARELANLEHLEEETYAAWQRSKEPKQSQKVEMAGAGAGGSAPTKTTRETEKRDGEIGFINTLVKISERRAKLMGLDAAVKAELHIDGELKAKGDIDNLRGALKRAVLAKQQALPILPELAESLG